MALPDLMKSFEGYGSFVILNQQILDDGEGGYITEWTEGAHFNAVVTLDISREMLQAQAAGVAGNYTVTFEKNGLRLPWHTVFRRESDNQVFRVTTKDEVVAPNGSMIETRITKAEEWVLPDE